MENYYKRILCKQVCLGESLMAKPHKSRGTSQYAVGGDKGQLVCSLRQSEEHRRAIQLMHNPGKQEG